MSLRKYKAKRDFKVTPEPAGKLHKAAKRLEFVIQKHQASRLHYDFRLELDGVLKSWAVPKGPSLNPKDRRLAMMVEDHPYEYRKFEGVIPEGNYGAGNVIIWDRGWYELDRQDKSWPKTLEEGLKKGELKFILHGEKLKGSFALIKTPHMGQNAWLLIKHKDKYAKEVDITEEGESVVSKKTVETIGSQAEVELNAAPKSKMPTTVKPMLATLVSEPFDDPDWLFEIKWDGYRAIGAWDGKEAQLYSRTGQDFSQRYAPVREALHGLEHQVVLDGEIVAIDEEGHAHFSWLQNYKSKPEGHLIYYVFDLLWCDGHDLRGAPLKERKQTLKHVLRLNSQIYYSDHIEGQGKKFFASASSQHLEGIMAKNGNSIYKEGKRSEDWLKIKTHLRQEAVIGGFTEPRGSRKYIGALILGVYEDDKLIYVGHAGGGIPSDQLNPLRQKLENLERPSSPFASKVKPNAPVHWVEPKLVCEVKFGEWTNDGLIRQPIFMGLREDKNPRKVWREQPKALGSVKEDTKSVSKSDTKKGKLTFSHLGKVFFPDKGYTKGDLIDYYQSVSGFILPYLKGRPHSLKRQPNGIAGESFFQKDVGDMPPKWVKKASIYSESNEKNINYLVCDSKDSLLYMVQLGCIEINPWNSRVKKLNKPDWLVIDLDPEDIGFAHVVEAALITKKICDGLKIPTYPKTSGKTGIHIFMPLAAKYTYDQTKQLAEILANLIHEQLPDTTSVERNPKKRQKKIYVDFLQNREGQTLAAPYSVRPTPEASVSTPLHWEEVNKRLDPKKFTIKNTLKRLQKEGDLWRPVLGKGIDIKKVLKMIG